MEDLAAVVGTPVLAPTALPAGCGERERFTVPAPASVAYLTYTCVVISQQAVVRGGVAHAEQPRVGAGALQEATVAGEPAYFMRGAWVVDAQGQQVWQEGFGLMLTLERDGLIIRLRAGNLGAQPEVTLVRIAESLWPVQSPRLRPAAR